MVNVNYIVLYQVFYALVPALYFIITNPRPYGPRPLAINAKQTSLA